MGGGAAVARSSVGHTTGKCIFKAVPTAREGTELLLCIDGQQRTTTHLLLFTALRDAAQAATLDIQLNMGQHGDIDGIGDFKHFCADGGYLDTTHRPHENLPNQIDDAANNELRDLGTIVNEIERLLFLNVEAMRHWAYCIAHDSILDNSIRACQCDGGGKD